MSFTTNLKQDEVFYARFFMIVEAFLVYVGFWVSHFFSYPDPVMQVEVLLVTLVTVGLFHVVYSTAGMYNAWRGIRISAEFRRVLGCWLVIVAGAGLFAFLTRTGLIVSRLWFAWGVACAFVLVVLFRFSVRTWLARARRKGMNFRSVALVGADRNCAVAIERLISNRWVGLEPVAIFDDDPNVQGRSISGVPVLGNIHDVYDYVETRRRQHDPIDQVWILLNDQNAAVLNELLNKLEDSSVDVRLVPNFFGLPLNSGMIDQVAEIPMVNLSRVRKDRVSEAGKSIMDFSFALLVVTLLSPLLITIAIAIKLDSPGRVIFKQRRYGVNGKEIRVWKFRTMTELNDGTAPVQQAKRGDKRITRIGRFLRRTSLDELPQFFNVLRGEMSVVGPRPHAVSHNEEYRNKIRGYMNRHKTKPGITGWAQVHGWRGETDTLDKMENRVRYDIEYINNWSMWLDLKIIAMTIVRGFVHKNAY